MRPPVSGSVLSSLVRVSGSGRFSPSLLVLCASGSHLCVCVGCSPLACRCWLAAYFGAFLTPDPGFAGPWGWWDLSPVRVRCDWACVPKPVALPSCHGTQENKCDACKSDAVSLFLLAADSGKKKSSFNELKFSSLGCAEKLY